MTRIAYFDCFSGISGNMALGALLDCGLSPDALREGLARLPLNGYRLEVEEIRKSGLRGLHVRVALDSTAQPHRHLADIEAILQAGGLPERALQRSLQVFRRLAEAEAKVHGEPVNHVHFHEVGAVDAIVDVAGTMLGLELLGVDTVRASAVPNGHGMIESAHGLLPLPAPATAELLRGVPQYSRDVEAELVTPTGAAILAGLADGFGPAPAMRVESIGYGAGTRDLPWANLLRVSVGEAGVPDTEDSVWVVEANIDDMNPEWFEHAAEILWDAGALDVYQTPILMKHSRPAVTLGVMVEDSKREAVLAAVFAETTTIGVRMYPVERRKLVRENLAVETEFGPVSVKVGRRGESVLNLAPEYRDCRAIAKEKQVPIKRVYEAALAAARRQLGG